MKSIEKLPLLGHKEAELRDQAIDDSQVTNKLNQRQKECFLQALREGDCSQLQEYALILLLQNDGKTYEEIKSFNQRQRLLKSLCL